MKTFRGSEVLGNRLSFSLRLRTGGQRSRPVRPFWSLHNYSLCAAYIQRTNEPDPAVGADSAAKTISYFHKYLNYFRQFLPGSSNLELPTQTNDCELLSDFEKIPRASPRLLKLLSLSLSWKKRSSFQSLESKVLDSKRVEFVR